MNLFQMTGDEQKGIAEVSFLVMLAKCTNGGAHYCTSNLEVSNLDLAETHPTLYPLTSTLYDTLPGLESGSRL